MACDIITHFPDGALLMVIDGVADPAVSQHVAQCADCTADLKLLRETTTTLLASLYRATCPTSLQLGEYSLGLLPTQESTLIESHLVSCPHCSAELGQLDAFMAEPEPMPAPSRSESLAEPVRMFIARLVSGLNSLGQPAITPAFAALRGSVDGPVTYEAGEYRAVIEIDEDLDRPDQRALTGLLIGPSVAGVAANLWQHGKRVATTEVDAFGNFELLGLEAGDYELILSGSGIEIHIQSLPVS